MYPNQLQLYKANSSEKQAFFLNLNIPIENGYLTTTIYDKREYFNFNIVKFSDFRR